MNSKSHCHYKKLFWSVFSPNYQTICLNLTIQINIKCIWYHTDFYAMPIRWFYKRSITYSIIIDFSLYFDKTSAISINWYISLILKRIFNYKVIMCKWNFITYANAIKLIKWKKLLTFANQLNMSTWKNKEIYIVNCKYIFW